jgi:hypothetical protein
VIKDPKKLNPIRAVAIGHSRPARKSSGVISSLQYRMVEKFLG